MDWKGTRPSKPLKTFKKLNQHSNSRFGSKIEKPPSEKFETKRSRRSSTQNRDIKYVKIFSAYKYKNFFSWIGSLDPSDTENAKTHA